MKYLPVTALGLALVASAVGCHGSGPGERPHIEGAIYGDGTRDPSDVIARVGDFKITQRMLDLRMEELRKDQQTRYAGPEGQRAYSREMVNEYLRVREAEHRRLEDDPKVARVLISERRQTLDLALINDLVKDKKPSIDQIRQYYLDNRDKYQLAGSMHAAHIECATQADADKAYTALTKGKRPFPYVVHDYSIDAQTKDKDGDLGWFNKDGFIPSIKDSKAFTEAIWDCKNGINPPLKFGDHWHIIDVYERKYDRPQTLDEAYDHIVKDMMPDFQTSLIAAWADSVRAQADVEYYGDYRPGKGLTARELFDRANTAADPQQKLQLWEMLVDDYPNDELADDALFLAGNLALDTWGDQPRAGRLLRQLIDKYPNSEYVSDAQYILDNMGRPNFVRPKSIEDLRAKTQ